LLFGLRKVDAKELIARVGGGGVPAQKAPAAARILDSSKLADVFGIDLSTTTTRAPQTRVVVRKKSLPGEKVNAAPRAAKRPRARSRGTLK